MDSLIERGWDTLTARRRQVAILAGQGLSNRAIAEKLGLSEGTVRVTLHKVFQKLKLSHRIDLVIDRLIDRPKRLIRLESLTASQRRVATLACRKLSNSKIAKRLGVTEGTVKTHLRASYKKLGVRSRLELAKALADRSRSTANSL
jgi:DNA-binding NarL/FixJ family response regulator